MKKTLSLLAMLALTVALAAPTWARSFGERESGRVRETRETPKVQDDAVAAQEEPKVEKVAPVEKPKPSRRGGPVRGGQSAPRQTEPGQAAPAVQPAQGSGVAVEGRGFRREPGVRQENGSRPVVGGSRPESGRQVGKTEALPDVPDLGRGSHNRPRQASDVRTVNRAHEGGNGADRRPAGVHPGSFRENREALRGVPKPEPIRERKQLLMTPREHSRVAIPQKDHEGRPLKARRALVPPASKSMNVYINNRVVLGNVTLYNRTENVRGRYYWHDYGGSRYCHYYDPWGSHWYGWYLGSDCYWTRYHDNRWWWYDDQYDRWNYWNNGYWWWQDPVRTQVVYVYRDRQYYSTSDEADYDQSANDAPPAVPDLANDAPETIFNSRDRSRTVKIFGEYRDAFLYDTSPRRSFSPIFLVSGAKEARFTQEARGKITEIMVLLENGTYELFYPDGQGVSR